MVAFRFMRILIGCGCIALFIGTIGYQIRITRAVSTDSLSDSRAASHFVNEQANIPQDLAEEEHPQNDTIVNLPLIFLDGTLGQSPDGTGSDERADAIPTATLVVHPPNTYSLNVLPDGEGLVFISPYNLFYDAGQPVVLDALAVAGWAFSHWSGALNGNTNPVTILMSQDRTVTAHFIIENALPDEPDSTPTAAEPATVTALPTTASTAVVPIVTNSPTSVVATVTSTATDILTATETPTHTSTATSTATATQTLLPGETVENTPTSTPTATPMQTSTNTPTPTSTLVPTSTNRPEPTSINTLVPTSTLLPPETAVPTLVPTLTLLPDETSVPIEPLITNDDLVTAEEDGQVLVDVTANDSGNQPLTVARVNTPQNGTVSITDNSIRYIPNADFYGADRFIYGVEDNAGQLGVATVFITVTAINDAPIIVDQFVSTDANVTLTILLSAVDVDSDALAFIVSNGPTNGIVDAVIPIGDAGATVRYTPFAGFSGSDSLTVQVTDDGGLVDTGIVTITVNPAPQSGDEARIYPATTAPIIDGSIDAIWSTTPWNNINNVVIGTAPSPTDISAQFRGLFNTTHLYLLVEVTDDILIHDSTDMWWRDDVIEIFTDGNLSRGSIYDGFDDMQLFFRWNDGDVVRSGVGSIGVPDGLQNALIQTGDGYRLELAIPLAQIGLASGNDVPFGLDVHIADDDDGGDSRENKLTWWALIDQVHENPSLMGTGRLLRDIGP